MTHPRNLTIRWKPALTLGLSLTLGALTASALQAQPLSSGSGAGTGTGMSGGASRNTTGSGLESGSANSTGTGNESGSTIGLPGANTYINPSRGRNLISPGRGSSRGSIPAGPGVGDSLPGDVMVPLNTMTGAAGSGAAEASVISDIHLDYARRIAAPGDRSLALSRVASAATFSNQLVMADQALTAAAAAAMEMPNGLVRDQRLISIISALLYLGEAHLREGRTDVTLPDSTGAPAAIPKVDRIQLIDRALNATLRAARLAEQIGNPTYRSELMYRVADGLALDSQSIVTEFPKEGGSDNKGPNGLDTSYGNLPDRMLTEAATLAQRIERPVWRDRGLVTIASAAAESRQFSRALEVARRIPQPEVRTDALLRIADLQSRRGDPDGATSTYREAAQAVASIPLADPRAVLAGVLIDSLISNGRFDDARASINLYPDEARRLIALGAIAESQGLRGAARSALAWINTEVPPEYRSQLYRRVSNGVVTAIENNRSRDLSNRGER